MLRLRSESWRELTHFWESSAGIMGRSPEGGGDDAAETSRAVRAWAAKSQAARTGQQRLRSRVGPPPQAALTPPKSSLERSRRQIRDWVWVGYAGTVLESRVCGTVCDMDARKTRYAIKEVNDCIFAFKLNCGHWLVIGSRVWWFVLVSEKVATLFWEVERKGLREEKEGTG